MPCGRTIIKIDCIRIGVFKIKLPGIIDIIETMSC